MRPFELVAEIQRLSKEVQSWKGAHSVAAADRDILKAMCVRAADALESNQFDKYSPVGVDLIAELRKAAE